MHSGSSTIAGETVVERVVRTLLGGAQPPDHEQLVAAARERYGDQTPFAGTLARYATGHPGDLRAREAFLILCLARPAVARAQGLEPIREGRLLARALEAAGQARRAGEVLGLLFRRHPDDAELEAQCISNARRTGRAEPLVEQFLQRSEELAAAELREDAVRWLRKALLLAPGRRDIAARIRDLQRGAGRGPSRVLHYASICLLLAGMAGGMAWLATEVARRELDVSHLYGRLPEARAGDRASLEQRLAALETLMEAHPVWHGTLTARRERIELELQLEALRWNESLERARNAEEPSAASSPEAEALAEAEAASRRARTAVRERALERAVAEYELALRSAPPDWESAARVRADLAAVRAHLAAQDTAESGTD